LEQVIVVVTNAPGYCVVAGTEGDRAAYVDVIKERRK
jgi:hypothetical protein